MIYIVYLLCVMITDIIVIVLLCVIIILVGWQTYWKNNTDNSLQQVPQWNYSQPQPSKKPISIIKKKTKKHSKHVGFNEDECRSLGAYDDTLSDIGSVAGL